MQHRHSQLSFPLGKSDICEDEVLKAFVQAIKTIWNPECILKCHAVGCIFPVWRSCTMLYAMLKSQVL